MPAHIVTFGDRYRREPHPVLGNRPTLPDGYGVIQARTYRQAVETARTLFGVTYSNVYINVPENTGPYPAGHLFTVYPNAGTPILTWTQKDKP